MFKLILLLAVAAVSLAYKDYNGYRLISLTPIVKSHLELLGQWENQPGFDIWKEARGLNSDVEVLLSPIEFEKYKLLFAENKFPYTVLHEDVGKEVRAEQQRVSADRLRLRGSPRAAVSNFERYSTIMAFLDATQQANPTIVSVYNPGQSLEGRDLKVLKINTNSGAQEKAWFDCGIHAREWISPVTCLNLIDKFIADYKAGNTEVLAILNKYELHFMPLLNPDGYEYTHTSDRYWRKNRRVNPGSTCRGVDLNRNFGFQWFTGGSSNDPCSDTFAGASADSEPETKVLESIIRGSTWKSYISLHSYGMWFLTEWGYTTALPKDYAEMKRIGDLGNAACQATHGQSFTVGSTANLLYIASGASSDWAYGSENIVYSYVLELRPKNSFGTLGFSIAASEIPFVANEIYATVKAALKNMK